jgi:ComF family protein
MRCRQKEWPFDGAISLFAYRDKAAALIGAYKFRNRFSLAAFFAEACADRLASTWPGLPLVPVPFRRKKIVEKGWDQVEAIARRLSGLGFEVLNLLERLPSGEQKRLGLDARLENARKAYRLKPGVIAPPACVLLDDVFTTGATAAACAEALKEGGASTVFFLALASD